MSGPKCSRVWIVEAIRDGRVKGSEREAFERHLPTCSDCLGEAKWLDDIAKNLRGLPVDEPDVFSVRRQRQRLMADSDAVLMRQANSSWPRRLGYAMAITAATGLIFGWSRWSRRDAKLADEVIEEPIIDVQPEPGARWRHTRSGNTNGVELDDGTIALRIQRRATAGRIIIDLPDGEIEDFGTVLRVRVAEARTAEVRVEEGHVAIRVRGIEERRLGPGESWAPPVEPPSPNVAPPASHEDLPGPESGGLHPASPESSHVAIEPAPHARSVTHADKHVEKETSAASESHDAEDQAYLQVIDLARVGKTSQARTQAREYLLRFPNGFRRVEMLDIATGRSESH